MKTAQSGRNDERGYSIIRMTMIAATMALMTACASQPGNHYQARLDSQALQCPTDTVPTCEVIGGNKFQKRYGRCACWRR